MKKACLAFLTAMLVLSAVGCKKPGAAVVGSWNGPNGAVLTFKDDMTFSQDFTAKGASAAMAKQMAAMRPTGTWKMDDKKVVVSILKIGDKTVDEEFKSLSAMIPASQKANIDKQKQLLSHIEMKLSDDAKTLTMTDLSGKNTSFTKADTKT